MNKQLFSANTANVTLSAALSANAATVQLSASDAALFPTIASGSGDYFLLTLGGGQDVRKITDINKTTGVLTSAGTVEGTAMAWASGASAINAATAGTLTTFAQGNLIPPSGDTTGAADAAAINNMLNLTGLVTLQPNAQYYLNVPITMGSNSVLSAYGAKLKLVAGAFGNILRNKAVLPSRTVTDGVVTAGLPAVTSLTANFVAGDVGSMIGIFGAAAGGAAWYGPILSINNSVNSTAWATGIAKTVGQFGRPTALQGNLYQVTTAGTTGTTQPTWPTAVGSTVTDGTVVWTCLGAATAATLNNNALTSVVAGTVNVFATADRNDNITVLGGDYTITENLGGGHIATSTFQNSFACAFRRISNLRIKDTTWTTNGPVNQGGRFTVSIADFYNVAVDGTYLVSTAGDGIHMTGPGDVALVTNTRGTAGDDMVVTNLQDSNTAYIMDTEGSMSNVTVRDLIAKNGGSRGFCHYEIGSLPTRWSMSNLHLEKLSGTTYNPMVLIQTAVTNLTMRGIIGAPTQANVPLISVLAASGTGSGITAEDITWNSLLAATSGIMRIADPRGNILVKNMRFSQPSAGTNYGLYLNGTLNGANSGNNFGPPVVTIDGFYTGSDIGGAYGISPADSTALYFGYTLASSGSTTVNIRNCFNRSNTGFVVQKTAPGQINQYNISDSQVGGTALAQFPATDNPTTVRLSNVKCYVPLVKTSSVVTLEAMNCDFSTSAALVQLTGTGASATIRLTNSAQAGSGVLVSRDGTQTIRVRGTDIPVDQTLLTPADGDEINNSNATPANGVGVATWNAAAAKWKNTWSGVTN